MECEVCGNESGDTFQVVRHVGRHTFDTFECAVYAMAPICAHCGVRVMGHPVKDGDRTFCCSHCAEAGPRQREEQGAEGQEEEEVDEVEDEVEDEERGEEEEEEEEEEGDEPGDQDLEKLDERISQARQSADDLLTSPEDEVDQDEADVEPEAEVGEEESGERDQDDDDEKG